MLGKKKKADAEPVAEAEEGNEGAAKTGGADAATEGEAGAEGAVAAAPEKSKKKLIIIAVGAIVLLAAIGAGLFFSGILGKAPEKTATEMGPDGKPIEKPVFYTLPDFLINLNSQGKAASFLKATVVIEVAHQADVPIIESELPKVVDAINTYMRELHPSDLTGSAGIQRLREEMLLRVNKALAPVKINDVLFKEIVVQ